MLFEKGKLLKRFEKHIKFYISVHIACTSSKKYTQKARQFLRLQHQFLNTRIQAHEISIPVQQNKNKLKITSLQRGL